MIGDAIVLDPDSRDADRVVLCRCGGFGRIHHRPVNRLGEPEAFVRSGFSCTWNRPGAHGPLLPPRSGTPRPHATGPTAHPAGG